MFAFAALEPLLVRGLLVIGIAIAAWGAWHEFTGHYIDIGKAQVQALWDADKAKREKALTDMTMLWDQQRQKAEAAQEVAQHAQDQLIAQAQAAARALPPAVAAIRIPAVAVRVPNDALDREPGATGPPAQPGADTAPSAADSDVGLVVGWIVDTVIPLYNACRVEVTGWQAYYASLQAAQPKGASP